VFVYFFGSLYFFSLSSLCLLYSLKDDMERDFEKDEDFVRLNTNSKGKSDTGTTQIKLCNNFPAFFSLFVFFFHVRILIKNINHIIVRYFYSSPHKDHPEALTCPVSFNWGPSISVRECTQWFSCSDLWPRTWGLPAGHDGWVLEQLVSC